MSQRYALVIPPFRAYDAATVTFRATTLWMGVQNGFPLHLRHLRNDGPQRKQHRSSYHPTYAARRITNDCEIFFTYAPPR